MKRGNKRHWSFLRNGLRRLSLRWPPRNEVIKNARRAYKGNNKRQKWEYHCNKCGKWFKSSEIQVDHIIPCGPLTCASHIKDFVLTLFCEVDNLQVLCKSCHTKKTNLEN